MSVSFSASSFPCVSELSLDMSFHVRYLDCAAKGSVEKLKKIETFIDCNYQNEVRHWMMRHTHIDIT